MTTCSIQPSPSQTTSTSRDIQIFATAAVVAVSVVVMPVFTLFASSLILNGIGVGFSAKKDALEENRKNAMICHSIALLAIGCAISISGLGFFTGAAAVISIALLAKNVWDLHHPRR